MRENKDGIKMLRIFLFIFVVFTSCVSKTEKDLELEKEKLKNTLTAMWDAIEREDIESYASYIHPNFTQFGETDPILQKGKEAEIAGVKSWILASEDIHTEMIKPIVTIKNDVAWIVYYWSDHGKINGKDFSTKGKSTRIFVKENGKWLCIHGHYTLLP